MPLQIPQDEVPNFGGCKPFAIGQTRGSNMLEPRVWPMAKGLQPPKFGTSSCGIWSGMGTNSSFGMISDAD